jgi:hypothetical protein
MVEHEGIGRLMPPDPDLYVRIIRHARERNGGMWRYAAPERKLHAQPVVEAMIARWRELAGQVCPTEQLPEVL